MSAPTESPKLPQDHGLSVAKAGRRRRLLGVGSAVTVLASLKSGSSLAAGVCTTPSAFTSIAVNPATSQKPPLNPSVCHSHGYWKDRGWPISRDTKVSDVFCGVSTSARLTAIGITNNTTLHQVVIMGGGGADRALAADLISAYLDSFVNGAGYFTAVDIQKMWALVFCGIPYSVNGTAWTSATVRDFLNVLIGS